MRPVEADLTDVAHDVIEERNRAIADHLGACEVIARMVESAEDLRAELDKLTSERAALREACKALLPWVVDHRSESDGEMFDDKTMDEAIALARVALRSGGAL